MSISNNPSLYPQEITAYKRIRIIGRGSFGSLYEGIVLEGAHKNEHVAIKQIRVDKDNLKIYKSFKVSTIICKFICYI